MSRDSIRSELGNIDGYLTREEPQHGEPPVDGATELELAYEELHLLREAILACTSFEYDPDASYDEGSWRDLTRYRLAFNNPGFEDLIDALGIEVKRGQSVQDAFEEARAK